LRLRDAQQLDRHRAIPRQPQERSAAAVHWPRAAEVRQQPARAALREDSRRAVAWVAQALQAQQLSVPVWDAPAVRVAALRRRASPLRVRGVPRARASARMQRAYRVPLRVDAMREQPLAARRQMGAPCPGL
jgi:hypothetical protein